MSQHSLETVDRGLADAFYQGAASEFLDLFQGGDYSESWQLAEASGLTDLQLVDRLVGLGIRPSTLTALALVPLIEVAWADGHMDAKEREAILAGARATGLEPESPSYRLLRIWTRERPAPALVEAWQDFVRETVGELSEGEREQFRARLMERATDVASAAGGILGLTSKISRSERRVLAELDRSFES
ncbi:MAG: hypothetical protein CL910_21480 [Deltaproteobacteria bacterium]|nr:hypothetical protein [Deltaproteobacteria bacterium]